MARVAGPAREEVSGSGTVARRPPLWPGLAIGIGLAGTLDEVVLHQLLHWHHLYDRSTPTVGLVSDGLFHLFSTALLVAGMYGLWQNYPRGSRAARHLWGAICVGLGGFNFYDATIQHKVLRLHQVRPDAPNWLPYDLAFGGIALTILALGLFLLRGGARAAGSGAAGGGSGGRRTL